MKHHHKKKKKLLKHEAVEGWRRGGGGCEASRLMAQRQRDEAAEAEDATSHQPTGRRGGGAETATPETYPLIF